MRWERSGIQPELWRLYEASGGMVGSVFKAHHTDAWRAMLHGKNWWNDYSTPEKAMEDATIEWVRLRLSQ